MGMDRSGTYALPLPIKLAALVCALAFSFTVLPACDGREPNPTPKEMTPIASGHGELHADRLVRDSSSPKVKLRRNKDGTYSWEIVGEDVDAILEADKKLRSLNRKPAGKKAD